MIEEKDYIILLIIKFKDSGNGVSYKPIEMLSRLFKIYFEEREKIIDKLILHDLISFNNDVYMITDKGESFLGDIEMKKSLETLSLVRRK